MGRYTVGENPIFHYFSISEDPISRPPPFSIHQSIIAEDLSFGDKHTETILAWVEAAVLLVESSLFDSALYPFFP